MDTSPTLADFDEQLFTLMLAVFDKLRSEKPDAERSEHLWNLKEIFLESISQAHQRVAAATAEPLRARRDPFLGSLTDRMDDHLDGIKDTTLLLLKGHLLIEEALTLAVEGRMSRPQLLREANLRFPQLVNLARSLFDLSRGDKTRSQDSERIWNAMLALNSIRNQLAHRLDPVDMSPQMERFFLTVEIPKGVPLLDSELRPKVNMALGFLYGIASSLAYDSIYDQIQRGKRDITGKLARRVGSAEGA